MVFERTKNASRNIITGLFNKTISIVMPFIIRTVIIQKLGIEYLGIDNLFASVLQVLNLSELGLSSAIGYCMYKPLAQNDIKKVNALYLFVSKAYTVVGMVVLVLGIGLLPFLKYFIHGEIPTSVNIYFLYLIYLFNSVISYLLFAYKNVLLNANQRLDISNNILTITRMVMYIVQLIVLFLFKNYYIYILFLPICTICNNLLISKQVNKMFPDFKLQGDLDIQTKKEIKYQVLGLFIGKVSQVSRNSFDSIIVSSLFGLTLTAIYNNYYYIINAIVAIVTIINSSIIPSIGNSVATESVEKNYGDFQKFNYIYMWIAGVSTSCLFCLYQPFMKIWVGNKNMLPGFTMSLFTVYFFCLMIGSVRASYIEATGLWWQNRWRSIIESVANLILNILLGKLYGINGILIATIVTILLINFIGSSRILFKYYFSDFSIKEYYFHTVIYALVTLLASLVSWVISVYIPGNGVIKLLLIGIETIIVSNIVFLGCYVKFDLFHKSKSWIISKVVKRR